MDITGTIASFERHGNSVYGFIQRDSTPPVLHFWSDTNCDGCFDPALGMHVLYAPDETVRGYQATHVHPNIEPSAAPLEPPPQG
jgi:cold shock CspA family protein